MALCGRTNVFLYDILQELIFQYRRCMTIDPIFIFNCAELVDTKSIWDTRYAIDLIPIMDQSRFFHTFSLQNSSKEVVESDSEGCKLLLPKNFASTAYHAMSLLFLK